MESTRRTFFRQIAGFAVLSGGLQMFLSACGGSSSYSASGNQPSANNGTSSASNMGTGNCKANGTTVTVGGNHGHTPPDISAADVTAGSQKQYSLGASDAYASPPYHTHTVTLTAVAFGALQGNTAQTVTTDADYTGHTHPISIGCV